MQRPTCAVDVDTDGVCVLTLSRPSRANALNEEMWNDFTACVKFAGQSNARCVVVRGDGRHFCAGIDVADETTLKSTLGDVGDAGTCEGRRRESLLRNIKRLQDAFTALERDVDCPTIACVRGACYGAGVDMITACDVRVCCAKTARFCVKEVDLGITADVGTLQRLPSIIGFGRAMELAMTAREIDANEALAIGLVSEVCDDVEARAMALAKTLAKKSPLALRGTKRTLLRQRDDPNVARGLDYVATHNAAMLMSDDLNESLRARFEKREPIFAKL
jgi:delta(3,5)-delta(2,4)-dienoyl-CoA isomerase